MTREGLSRLTIEIPEELHRHAKVRAAYLGEDIRTLVIDGLRRVLADGPSVKVIAHEQAARLEAPFAKKPKASKKGAKR